jgi:hypothetical protein
MQLWWLSFADAILPVGNQFLGAAMVRASNMIEAVQVAHLLGINPGGEVVGVECDPSAAALVPAKYVERLLSRDEIEAFETEMASLRPTTTEEP